MEANRERITSTMRISLCPFSYRPSYYLRHPLVFLKEIRTLVVNAYHRMRYGYAWVDLWNMDDYLGQLVPNMLRDLANKSSGYPCTDEFPDPETYKVYLRALAILFLIAEEDDEKGARTRLSDLHAPKYPIVESLYEDARAFIDNDISKLIIFAYAKLGEAAAYGLLWD